MIEKARRRFIGSLREHRECQKEALIFFTVMDKYLAELHWECTEKDYAIQLLLKEISLYVDIMQSYGIDVSRLGGRSIYSILSQVESAKQGVLTIPENLINYDKRKRHARSERLFLLPRCERRHLRVSGRNKRTGESRDYALDELR